MIVSVTSSTLRIVEEDFAGTVGKTLHRVGFEQVWRRGGRNYTYFKGGSAGRAAAKTGGPRPGTGPKAHQWGLRLR